MIIRKSETFYPRRKMRKYVKEIRNAHDAMIRKGILTLRFAKFYNRVSCRYSNSFAIRMNMVLYQKERFEKR